jgi:biopolymer transport protein ExbD
MQLNLRPKRRPVPAIPIVSLIDIMVILLIFFIATTTFREQKMQVKIQLPQSRSMGEAAPMEETRKTLMVTPNRELFLDGNPTDAKNLSAALKQLRSLQPQTKLELQADDQTPLGLLVQIWDSLREAGFSVNDVPARIRRPGQP